MARHLQKEYQREADRCRADAVIDQTLNWYRTSRKSNGGAKIDFVDESEKYRLDARFAKETRDLIDDFESKANPVEKLGNFWDSDPRRNTVAAEKGGRGGAQDGEGGVAGERGEE